jgi:hypothetical protein
VDLIEAHERTLRESGGKSPQRARPVPPTSIVGA